MTDRTIEWMRRFDYIRTPQEESSARAARFGALGALTHPHGSLDGAVLAAQAMVWLFLQDDRFSERAPAQGRIEDLAEHILCCQRVLHGPAEIPEPPGRYPAALLDLRIRLAGMAADPEQVERFTDGFNRYLAAVAAEAIYRVRGVTPDLAQYIRLRESTILMRGMCFVLIELADDCYLPGPLWARPDVRRCERAAALAIAYTHDILSGLRELYWPGHVNLITALARHLDRPLADALAEAVRMCEEQMALFQRLAGPLAEEGDERLARYVRGMGAWIRGNLDWSMTCGRYHVSSPRPSGESPGMFGA
ncbi:terpene synthase family protein [Embleya sp. NPDC001921]